MPRSSLDAPQMFAAFLRSSSCSTGATDQQTSRVQPTNDSQKPGHAGRSRSIRTLFPTRSLNKQAHYGTDSQFPSVSTDVKLPPMTVKEKFLTASDDSFDYSSVFIPAAVALSRWQKGDAGVRPGRCRLWQIFLARGARSDQRELSW